MNAKLKMHNTYDDTTIERDIVLSDASTGAVIAAIENAFDSADCTDETIFEIEREDGVGFYCEQWSDYITARSLYITAWNLYRHCNGSLEEWVANFKM